MATTTTAPSEYMRYVPDAMKPALGNSRDPSPQKLGHKCCGGCCDTRRAVIIVNGLHLTSIVLILFTTFFVHTNYNDRIGLIGMAINTLQVAAAVIGIIGALHFKMYLVGFSGLIYVLDAALSILGFHFTSALIFALYAYPHFFLMQEIKNGIMSEENYSNEEHSICCV